MVNRKNKIHTFLLLAFAFGLACAGRPAAALPHNQTTDRIIVKFKNEPLQLDKTGRPALSLRSGGAKAAAMHYKNAIGNGAYIYKLDAVYALEDAAHIAAELMQNEAVEYAEPDARRYPQLAPNDTHYAAQWYLHDSETAGGIRAESAWDITTGDAGVVIAVVDTGITVHSDITRLLPGYDFISDADSAGDSDGRDNDPADEGDAVAANECGPGEDTSDSSWHGTMVSGIIAADADADGIAGLNHQGSILPVRVLGKCGGFVSDIADGILWAAGLLEVGGLTNPNPADVINLSLGGTGSCSQTEQAAIDAAVAAGSTVVAAAGNEGMLAISSPANCSKVIAVAATTREGGETCYTNVSKKIDISAPGGNTNEGSCDGSTLPNDRIATTGNSGDDDPGLEDYFYTAGTSFATPMVAGAIGLMIAHASVVLAPAEIEAILKNTARTFPTGTGDGFRDCRISNCGAGILDIEAALNYIGNSPTDSIPDSFSFNSQSNVTLGATVESNTVTITGINTSTAVVIDGGAYSIDNGAFTSAAGSINDNQTIQLRQTAATAFSTTRSALLMVGGVRAIFNVQTPAPKRNGSGGGSSGGGGGGGHIGWLLLICIGMRIAVSLRYAHRRVMNGK
jgi:serine protease